MDVPVNNAAMLARQSRMEDVGSNRGKACPHSMSSVPYHAANHFHQGRNGSVANNGQFSGYLSAAQGLLPVGGQS